MIYFKYVATFLSCWFVVVVAMLILISQTIKLDVVTSTVISSIMTIAGMIPLMILASNLAIRDEIKGVSS